ncbi:MAG: hypothetical protein O3C48_08520 [Crenarchaeota archaeon]|nr:hypothetical protein [Thermoproteota archaeon]
MSKTQSGIINWENIFKHSNKFQNNNPSWAFVRDFFDEKFYDGLYETYPKIDDSWKKRDSFDKAGYGKEWKFHKLQGHIQIVENYSDNSLSEYWNDLFAYLWTDEFMLNIKKFSNVPVSRLKHFSFINYPKGGFQLPHIHNVGPSTLILMLYFSKGWEKNDPGGTYVCTEEDISTMIFEPCDLDNTAMIFHDGPNAGHGARRIEKDVERKAVQIYLEEYSEVNGWSGNKKDTPLVEL